MRKVFVIAQREYKAAVQTRAFLISLVVLPILIGGSVLLQWFVKDQVDTSEKRFAVIDRTPHEQLAAFLIGASNEWNKTRLDDARKTNRPAFLVEEIAPSADRPEDVAHNGSSCPRRSAKARSSPSWKSAARVLEPPALRAAPIVQSQKMRDADNPFSTETSTTDDRLAVRYQSNSPTYDAFRNYAGPVINMAIRESRYAAAGLPPKGPRRLPACPADEQRADSPQPGHRSARGRAGRKRDHFLARARRIAVLDVHADPARLDAPHAGRGRRENAKNRRGSLGLSPAIRTHGRKTAGTCRRFCDAGGRLPERRVSGGPASVTRS